jgi:hypothetical protein
MSKNIGRSSVAGRRSNSRAESVGWPFMTATASSAMESSASPLDSTSPLEKEIAGRSL